MAVRADTFFAVVLPLIIEEKRSLVGSVDAVIRFTVLGDEPGVWTADFRRGVEACVTAGAQLDPAPDMVLAIKDTFFDDFVRGDFDVEDAVETGRLGIEGRLGVLERLAAFLSGDQASATLSSPAAGLDAPGGGGVKLR